MYISKTAFVALALSFSIASAAPAPPISQANTVLVPLYIYPTPGAWDPLYQALTTYPDVNFTVIVNPRSGPGPDALPEADYIRELPKLNAFSNVQTVGYVLTGYGKRDMQTVLHDVSVYSQWAEASSDPGVAVHGIFFDETPSQCDAARETFYQAINTAVKGSAGLGNTMVSHAEYGLALFCNDHYDVPLERNANTYFSSTPLQTIFNPGFTVDACYTKIPDMTIVFEDTYRVFQDQNKAQQIAALPDGRDRYGVMINSVPATMSQADLTRFARQVFAVSRSVFLASLDTGFYESFSSIWMSEVKLQSSVNGSVSYR